MPVLSSHSPGSIARPASNLIRFRVRTIDRWISGEITTTQERLADILNREDTVNGLLVCECAWADESPSPTDSVDDAAPFAAINMSRVLLAVPIADRVGRSRDPFNWVQKRPDQVRIGVAQYEIDGNIYVVENGSLHDTIGLVRPQFFPVGSATIRDLSVLDVAEQHDIVLVNRRMVDYIMPRG